GRAIERDTSACRHCRWQISRPMVSSMGVLGRRSMRTRASCTLLLGRMLTKWDCSRAVAISSCKVCCWHYAPCYKTEQAGKRKEHTNLLHRGRCGLHKLPAGSCDFSVGDSEVGSADMIARSQLVAHTFEGDPPRFHDVAILSNLQCLVGVLSREQDGDAFRRNP